MEIFGPLLISTICGLSTTLGSLIILIKIKESNIKRFITFCLSFSIAIMIGISIIDLIPNSLFSLIKNNLKIGIILAILAFLGGVILIKIVSFFINKQSDTSLYRLGILNMIALMLHNFPEGIATFLSSYQDINLGLKLGMAIMLHNIPEGISIAVPIYYATKVKFKAIKEATISGLAEPMGALLAFLVLKNFITDDFISIILLIVAGIMITISIEEIYPHIAKYKERKYFILGFIIGLIIIVINHYFF